jgi:hypothetical protein
MLSTDATAMAALSGQNLGTILQLVVDIVSVVIVAYPLALAELTAESCLRGNSVSWRWR